MEMATWWRRKAMFPLGNVFLAMTIALGVRMLPISVWNVSRAIIPRTIGACRFSILGLRPSYLFLWNSSWPRSMSSRGHWWEQWRWKEQYPWSSSIKLKGVKSVVRSSLKIPPKHKHITVVYNLSRRLTTSPFPKYKLMGSTLKRSR